MGELGTSQIKELGSLYKCIKLIAVLFPGGFQSDLYKWNLWVYVNATPAFCICLANHNLDNFQRPLKIDLWRPMEIGVDHQ